jgi:phosphoribosylformylglycinamidine synthase
MRGPTDAAVIKPLVDNYEGLVISHGICPKFIQDAKDMALLAFDEAVRNALATGAKFGYLAALDNFSWPDPLPSTTNPDAEYKLAQLVRACIALYDYATAYGIPFISGKDSLKNDYVVGDERHSILPTLLITLVGKMDDVRKAVTPEFKNAGDYIYILGKTRDELGASE